MGHRRADDSGSNDPLRRPDLLSVLFGVHDLPYSLSDYLIRGFKPSVHEPQIAVCDSDTARHTKVTNK